MEMDPKEIESIQSQIDELNHLLAEATEPVYSPLKRLERLGILLLKLQDGELEGKFVHRLEKWLRADPEALTYYVDFMMLCAVLRCYFCPDLGIKGLVEKVQRS